MAGEPFIFLSYFMKRKSLQIIGVLAITAAMVFAGCQQAAPQKAPEQVVKDGIKGLTAVTSYEFEMAMKGDLTGPSGQTPAAVKFNFALGGSADMKDNNDPKINLKFDGSGGADDQSASGSAEFRMNKDALYFTLAKLDTKGGQPLPKEMVDKYIGKWWKIVIPPNALKEFTASLPQGGSQQNLTPEQQKLKDLFEKTQFFKNIKFVAVEDVKGEQSAHYSADLDKDAFMAFAEEAAKLKDGTVLSDADRKDMQDAMKKFDFMGNIWVGQTSGVLNQVSGDIKLAGTSASEPSGTISMRVTLWNFNKPVTIQIPADAQEFPIGGLLGGMMGDPSAGASLDSSAMMPIPTDSPIPAPVGITDSN